MTRTLQKYTFDRIKTFSFHSLSSCVQPDLCDDSRNKSNINPRTVSLDILNGLISSAQDAKCPNESDVCCAKNSTKNPGNIPHTSFLRALEHRPSELLTNFNWLNIWKAGATVLPINLDKPI